MKWLYNGKLLAEEEVMIPANDHGFLYGIGLFETFRVYNNIPFLFIEHIDRLKTGIEAIGIDYKFDTKLLREQLNLLLDANNIKNAYIRLTVTAGTKPLGLPAGKYTNPSILWQIKPLPALQQDISTAKKAVILQTLRNLPEANIRLKSLNFLNNVIAKKEIWNLGETEGFFLTMNGHVAEGIVSNIFYVKDSQVYTPSLETGILNGITRQHVIFLCKSNGVPITEAIFTTKALMQADEIFITNSIQEIVPIKELNGTKFSINKNSTTDKIAFLYKESVKNHIIKEGEISEA